MKLKKLLFASLATAAIVVPQWAVAESDLQFGGTGTVASAQLKFTVIIQDFVYFRVGTVGAAPGATDRVEWDLGATQPGLGVDLAATGGDLDGADGALSISLHSNADSVRLAVDNFVLTNGTGDTIPNAEILVSAAGAITAPTFGTTQDIDTSGLSPINDTWTYLYDDSAVYPPGTYDGTATYTATTL
jgi:hypothetical protein